MSAAAGPGTYKSLHPLRFSSDALAAAHSHASEGYPFEVVGILAGSRAENEVSEVLRLVNERLKPGGDRGVDGAAPAQAAGHREGVLEGPGNRYRVDPLLQMRAEMAVEARGLEVVGYYHSHPDHPARYSEYDREHAVPNMSYTIVSVVGGAVRDTLSWRLAEDRSTMHPEPVTVLPAPDGALTQSRES